MNYGKIFYTDVANGPGCRTALFVSGCTHHCKGCFNEETWDFAYGKPFTTEVEDRIVDSIAPPYINGLTILGGEPMETQNQATLRPFLERVRKAHPDKSIWIYSGYTWEQLTDETNERCHSADTRPILDMIDMLVDGPFVEDKKDLTLRFRGSANQRIVDVKQTLAKGEIVRSSYEQA